MQLVMNKNNGQECRKYTSEQEHVEITRVRINGFFFFFCSGIFINNISSRMPTRSMVIVRGKYKGSDPVFSSLSHSSEGGAYSLLEFEEGRLLDRRNIPLDRKSEVDAYTLDGSLYKGTVYVDSRINRDLLPLPKGDNYLEADLSIYRRAKSDSEINTVHSLSSKTTRLLSNIDTEKTFRGSLSKTEGLHSAFKRTETRGFIQYRAGFKDSQGLVSDLTRIVPKTDEWAQRIERAYRGLDFMKTTLVHGAHIKDINNAFLSCMDPSCDIVYGNAIHHTGYQGHEDDITIDKLETYDLYKIGVAVGDKKTGEVALLYQGVQDIGPPPAPTCTSTHLTTTTPAPTNQSITLHPPIDNSAIHTHVPSLEDTINSPITEFVNTKTCSILDEIYAF